MKVNYKYASPSMCVPKENGMVLGFSSDLSREEQVSFVGKLKNPLIFRDAMLMLREIVVSDSRQQKKERVEFFAWLDQEIERRVLLHQEYLPEVRKNLEQSINEIMQEIEEKDSEIRKLIDVKSKLKKEIDEHDVWRNYYKLERDFWKFIRDRDTSLWFVLDPVITVHKDQVSFEAFSLDESTYGCLSIDMDEFDLVGEPKLGTTNIDFSAKLAKEMERFRTYTNVELAINPGGFTVDTGVMPEYVEKKIELPETWIKGFNQVSSASSLEGIDIEISPTDMYDICSFLRRNKEKSSPRYMKWILEPGKQVRILFEPFGKEIILGAVYNGKKKREEKIWGRRRWLVIEKIIPIAKVFTIRLLGFGMPQFIIGDLGSMQMTIGFSSWSANDWVKGTAFNILAGFVGNGSYGEVYKLMKTERALTIESINEKLQSNSKVNNKAGIGMLFKRGEGYFDAANNLVRFRKLCNIPINEELYETTSMELEVDEKLKQGMRNLVISVTENKEFIIKQSFNIPNSKYQNWRYQGTPEYNKRYELSNTEIIIDLDGQINSLKCKCSEFNRGPRNISAPCSHILALYLTASKILKLELEPNKDYRIEDIMEMLL
ncbi:hypothetical protein SAMN02745163_01420 [Clostridium cavendishii DSM 21758]|uniref:SWIM-type domain-containing protein n=1 Tax=Clostridium cavendishii DSM 21758 TaxID=1121302 RepID=A0A1M6GXJ6_9CLOT|nr:hypothetical protein [Clostridium cavendishii]SHJ14679.1 hypothetical protein SAMN02745163_01420 [Clostridium cavendishii DSM 21758]